MVVSTGNLIHPLSHQFWMRHQVHEARTNNNCGQTYVSHDKKGRQAYNFSVPLDEHGTQQYQQKHGYCDLAMHPFGCRAHEQRIGKQMRRCICRRQGLGDHKVCCCKSHQDQNKDL